MIEKTFKHVALMGRIGSAEISATVHSLYHFLIQQGVQVTVEQETAMCTQLSDIADSIHPKEQLGRYCDLAIIIGGDGSLLQSARALAPQALPVLGINRGRLGFLTDIHPQHFAEILPILAGHYRKEERFLLQTEVTYHQTSCTQADALNDVVLLAGHIARMIEFDIFINDDFLCSQRADGLIIATPTGSTAYALSAGGPILHPSLNALVLIPMCPHSLTNRPIVINGDSIIRLHIAEDQQLSPNLSCDGQIHIPLQDMHEIKIMKNPYRLHLIHPLHYQYFETLRKKLHWSQKMID